MGKPCSSRPRAVDPDRAVFAVRALTALTSGSECRTRKVEPSAGGA